MTRPEWVEDGEHDPLCSPDSLYGDDPEDEFCHCELVALIRADEQERNGFGHVDELEHDLTHAEAVAARLVEVICEQDGNARKDADAIFRLAQRDINAAIERDNLRAQIAADIEALHYPEAVFAYEVKADAARIARGESTH